MVTGLLGIKFKDNATDEEVQNFISNIYINNRHLIVGMQYSEFRSPDTLGNVYKFIDEIDDGVKIK